ncbi:MAG: hypothetical protein O3A01_02490 [bacterium]|nr:hypothetical protein [bacterium]
MYAILPTGFDTTTSNISDNLPPHLIRQYNATYPGFDASDTSTWPYKPLTEIVPMTWIAEIIAAGGELNYTQDSLAIPNTMPWLNGNGQRATIEGLDSAYPTSFKHFLLLKDDLMIIDHKRGNDHQNANSDMAAHRQAEEGFIARLKARTTAISGYTQSNVAMNADEVKALLLLLTHPSI